MDYLLVGGGGAGGLDANTHWGSGGGGGAFGRQGTGVKQQACRNALRDCSRDLAIRHRNGRNPRAYCSVDRF